MSGSVNKVILEEYISGASLTDLSKSHGIPVPTLRYRLHRAGALRSRAEGVRLAAARGKMSRRGPRGPMSEETKEKLSAAHLTRHAETASGFSVKPSGYVEHTRGEHKAEASTWSLWKPVLVAACSQMRLSTTSMGSEPTTTKTISR
jgi:hypothetical protein